MPNEEPISQTPENLLELPNNDPSGPPQPVAGKDPLKQLITGVGIGVVVLGGLLLPATCSVTQTCGANRSAKVQWEQRQQQIDQALVDQKSLSHE